MTLTIKELEAKIERIKEDIAKNSEDIKATETLQSYKEYLEDELRMMQHEEQLNRK